MEKKPAFLKIDAISGLQNVLLIFTDICIDEKDSYVTKISKASKKCVVFLQKDKELDCIPPDSVALYQKGVQGYIWSKLYLGRIVKFKAFCDWFGVVRNGRKRMASKFDIIIPNGEGMPLGVHKLMPTKRCKHIEANVHCTDRCLCDCEGKSD